MLLASSASGPLWFTRKTLGSFSPDPGVTGKISPLHLRRVSMVVEIPTNVALISSTEPSVRAGLSSALSRRHEMSSLLNPLHPPEPPDPPDPPDRASPPQPPPFYCATQSSSAAALSFAPAPLVLTLTPPPNIPAPPPSTFVLLPSCSSPQPFTSTSQSMSLFRSVLFTTSPVNTFCAPIVDPTKLRPSSFLPSTSDQILIIGIVHSPLNFNGYYFDSNQIMMDSLYPPLCHSTLYHQILSRINCKCTYLNYHQTVKGLLYPSLCMCLYSPLILLMDVYFIVYGVLPAKFWKSISCSWLSRLYPLNLHPFPCLSCTNPDHPLLRIVSMDSLLWNCRFFSCRLFRSLAPSTCLGPNRSPLVSWHVYRCPCVRSALGSEENFTDDSLSVLFNGSTLISAANFMIVHSALETVSITGICSLFRCFISHGVIPIFRLYVVEIRGLLYNVSSLSMMIASIVCFYALRLSFIAANLVVLSSFVTEFFFSGE